MGSRPHAHFNSTNRGWIAFACIFALTPGIAHADLIWDTLFLSNLFVAVGTVSAGLYIEYLFLRRTTPLGPVKAFLADVVMNAYSFLLGLVILPVITVPVRFITSPLDRWVKLGDIGVGVLLVVLAVSPFVNAWLEAKALKKYFKVRFDRGQTVAFRWVNFASSAIGAVVIVVGVYLANTWQ